jgi:hypothetical protein
MLVAHEVAHALYTPFTEEDKKSIKEHGYLSSAIKVCGNTEEATLAHAYMNVVEDARIERLIKDKFAGLRRDFYIAYGELHKADFFGLRGKNLQDFSFIDRINLFFKVGSHVKISFTDEEMDYVLMVENTRTFEDVVDVAKKIWEYSKKNKNRDQTFGSDIGHVDESDDNSDTDSAGNSTKKGNVGEKSNEGSVQDYGNQSTEGAWHTRSIQPDECLTQQNFDKKMQTLVNTNNYEEASYYPLPSVVENNVVVSFNTILSMFDKCVTDYQDPYTNFMADAKKFIETSNRVVNILAQEFMARKAAKDYNRNSVNRTGVIDTVRMVDYKFCDDIFKRLKVVKKGKSHGLVFYVDLSGSMSPVLEDTFKQLIQLVLFCRRVNIPFEVYGFTTKMLDGVEMDYYSCDQGQFNTLQSRCWSYPKTPYEIQNSVQPFTLVNMFSSKMTKTQTDVMIRNMFAVSSYYRRSNYTFSIPAIMHLSSTPLIEAIVASMDMVQKFKAENNLDIVNTIFMTDGEPTGVSMTQHGGFVHKNGITFKMENRKSLVDNMIKVFREVTGMKAICFFLHDKASLNDYVYGSYYTQDDSRSLLDQANKKYSKEGWISAVKTSHSYDEKFIIHSRNAVEDSDLDEILASKTSSVGIRNGFIKTMSQARTSRTMLNRFIDLITKE